MAAGSTLPPPSLQTPALPPIQGDASAAPSLSPQPASPASAPALTPQQPATPGIAQGTGKKQIATGPDDPPEFDQKKLAKAQTTLDLLNAMKPASRTDYMDWWEKTHGDIDEKYDNLKTQLGARPSDDEPQTRKEKFAALLEFGLHLMKASSAPSTNQGAATLGAVSDSVDAQKALVAKKQSDYDTQSNAIENARSEDLKGIGTPADAMKAQASLDKDRSEETRNTASAFRDVSAATNEQATSLGYPTYSAGPDGALYSLTRDADGKAHAEPVTGIDGKPFQGKVLGRSTGSGIDKGDTAQIRNQRYLSNVLGVDPDVATRIAFKAKSGNPMEDHKDVYRSTMQATMGDTDKAQRAADQYVIDNYGAHALSNATAPVVPNAPPPQALQGLKPGMVRDFGSNGRWTVGIDGKPQRVNNPLASP